MRRSSIETENVTDSKCGNKLKRKKKKESRRIEIPQNENAE